MKYTLAHDALIRLTTDGDFVTWHPGRRKHFSMNLGVLSVLAAFTGGKTIPEALAEAEVDDDDDARQAVDDLISWGLIAPESEAPQPGAAKATTPAAGATDEPIFVVGCPRSGTTLTSRILDAHPRIGCGPEIHIMPRTRDLFNELAYENTRGPSSLNGELWRHIHRNIIGDIMGAHAKARGKPRWADKTPANSREVEFIRMLYDGECRFVINVRHALDVTLSMRQKIEDGVWDEKMGGFVSIAKAAGQYTERDAFELGVRIWATINEGLWRFYTRHPELCFILRYEDLVGDPWPTLQKLFTFLGEEVDKSVLSGAFEREDIGGGGDYKINETTAIHTKSAGRWRSLPPGMAASVADLINPGLRRWGYEEI